MALPEISPTHRGGDGGKRVRCQLRYRRHNVGNETVQCIREVGDDTEKAETSLQISYLTDRPMPPYVRLQSVEKIYKIMQDKGHNDTPFTQILRTGGNKFVEFIDFSVDSWIKDSIRTSVPPLPGATMTNRCRSLMGKTKARRNTTSVPTANDSNAESFAASIQKFTAQANKEKQKREGMLLPKLGRDGLGPLIREILSPSISPAIAATNPVVQARQVCKDFYHMKMHIKRGCLKTLETIIAERPYATEAKQQLIGVSGAKGGLHAPEEMRIRER